ncbi:MAG: hypothetical protein MRY83_21630, partial [Flavobacteriales bacterium]|nr:hypothetical protein [Flavobacteriales bacterium]
MPDSNKLQQQINALLEIQRQNAPQTLSLEELKEVSSSMNISENDWLDLMEKADQNIQKAKESIVQKNYSDALTLAQEAVAINPNVESGNSVVAQSYL